MKDEQQKPGPSRATICECGGELRPTKFDVYDFSAYVGFNVTVSGADGFKCTKCGGETIDGSLLNAVMIHTIVQISKSRRRLNGDEARYLRHTLHVTQKELAEKMGIVRETVAKWECGDAEISPQQDFILRALSLGWMEAENLITREYMSEVLRTVFTEVRIEPPKQGTSIALSDPAAMMRDMAPRRELRAAG